jgi:hypothetical protein
MRVLGLVLGSFLLAGSVVSVACATNSHSGTGGAGGEDESWGNGPSTSSSASGSGGGGQLCEKACAKVLECGAEACPPEYLDCSMPNPVYECRGQCVLDANCAQILSIPTGNPDPALVACAEACGQGSASSSSSSSASSSSSSSSGAGGADAGACSTCAAHLNGVPADPPCAAAQPYVDALLTCACQFNCPTECAAVCAAGGGQPPTACTNCVTTYCATEATNCLSH